MTIIELKEKVKDLPDEGLVFIERIHDIYFDKHGWNVVKFKDGMQTEHEYIKAWCAVRHDKNDNLYIDAHS